MSDLKANIAGLIRDYAVNLSCFDCPDWTKEECADEIIALVRADYEQKVIEAVRGLSEGKSWDEWHDGYEFALKEAEKAIKQVMKDDS